MQLFTIYLLIALKTESSFLITKRFDKSIIIPRKAKNKNKERGRERERYVKKWSIKQLS